MLLKLNSLGVNSINFDLEPCDLPPEILTYGINYRLVNNKIHAFNMSKTLASPPSSFFAGLIMPILGPSGDFYLVAGRDAVYAYNGASWTDISSTAGYAPLSVQNEFLWQGCMLGRIPIINNPIVYPEYWSPQQTAQKMQPLLFKPGFTWQAMDYHAKVIRAHNNFLFAMNLTEGATELVSSYRWSHPADINGLPYTWDETDLAGIAGKSQLAANAGAIIDGLSLRDSFCIYSERAITMLDYVQGEFTWQARTLTSNNGLIAKNCVVEARGVHYFLSNNDILSNDGNTVESILHETLRTMLVTSLDATNYANSFAASNPITNEIWFCIPENGKVYPSLAIIYNYVDKTISVRKLPYFTTNATFGPVLQTPLTFANVTGTFANIQKTFKYDPTSQFSKAIVAIEGLNSSIISLELDDTITPVETLLERVSLALENQETVKTTQSVYPHMACNGPVLIQLGSQDFVGGPVRWKPAVEFNPSTQRKVDIRTTGKLLAYRISSIGNLPFVLSGLDIEYVINGRR
jgi:hypothetical protein